MYSRFTIFYSALTVAVATAAPPNFEDHILPILEQSCTNCHNPDKQKGGLDLSTYAAFMRGGSGGKVAEPGEGGDSRMYGVITHTVKPKMPPKGEKLGKKEADLIRAWIDGGLLENKSGKPKKKKKPAFALQAAPSVGKPDGPPPLPQHVLLEPVVTTTRGSVIADMAASPWAPLVAITGQRQVLLYHTDTLQLVGILPFDHGQPEALSFHPSGKYLLAGGGIGGKSGTTITWEVETGKEVLRAGKDFDSCLSASLRADLGGVSFGGPSKRVKLWDTSSDEQLISIKKHTDWVTQMAYSPDGVLLASGGRGGGVYIWEADTGSPFHTLRGHKAPITGVAWRSDSNLLATASEDGSVLIWEMNNGRQVKKINAHGSGVLSLDWTRNGHLVTSGRDNKVKIWKPDFNLLKVLPHFASTVTEVAFSHDGKRVFAADWWGAITVWDVATSKQVGSIAVNPPTIAQRITTLKKEIASQPGKITAAEKAVAEKTATHKAAKEHLVKTETGHRNALAKHKQLVNERTQLDAKLKKMHVEGDALNKVRQQRQHELTQARDALNKHNAAMANVRREHQQAENEIKKLAAHEQQLIKKEEAARKAAEAKPDDPALQQVAAKAKQELDNHRKKLGETRNLSKQKSTALAQLTQQQKNPGNRLAAANKAWKEITDQCTAHYAARKPIQERRNTLGKPINETLQHARHLEKTLKPSRERVKKTEVSVQHATNALKALRNQQVAQQKAVQHWQAAAMNTEALQLEKEAAELTAKQHAAMEAFTALSKEIQQLKDPAKLKEKSREQAKLRQQIDQAAPGVLGKAKEAQSRRQQYLKRVKQPATP